MTAVPLGLPFTALASKPRWRRMSLSFLGVSMEREKLRGAGGIGKGKQREGGNKGGSRE